MRKRTKVIGIIAEDDSDVETLYTLIRKITNINITVKKQVGHGCGKIKRKCNDWAKNLKLRGCHLLVIVHDLDDKKHSVLYNEIERALSPSPFKDACICIPIQELEAWLLSDANSLKKTFNLKALPKTPANPERINSPKEFLGNLITKTSGNTKIYLNTKHNNVIASNISIAELKAKCSSFVPLHNFLQLHL